MPLFKSRNDDPGDSPDEDSIDSLEGSFERAREELRRRSAELALGGQAEPGPNPLLGEHAPQRQERSEEQVQGQDEGSLAARAPFGLHPFFRGLLETLPEPGSEWSRKEREQWLETARNIFALIYKEPGDEREQATALPPVRLIEPQPQTARSEAHLEAPETQLDQRTA